MLKLLKYLKPIWWEVLIAVLLMGLESFFALAIPNFMGNITTIMENPTTYTSKMGGLVSFAGMYFITPTGNHLTDTWIIGGIMMTLAVLFLICAFGSSIINSFVGATYARNLRHDVFQKTVSMSVGEYYEFGTASLITRTTNDIEQTQNVLTFGLRILISSPVSFIIAIVMIFYRDATLALLVACTIPFIILTAVVLLILASPLFKRIQTAIDKLTSVLRESLKGVRVIRAFNQEDKEYDRFNSANTDVTQISIKTARIMSFGSPIISIIFDFTYLAIFCYGFTLISGQPSTVAIDFTNIIVGAEYAMQIIQSFLMFMFLLILVPRGQACAKRINEVLESENSIKEPLHPVIPKENTGVVEFKDVSFAFPGASAATLSHISFVAKPGKTTAIIGSTGSGKSTIINLIPRFYDVTEGSVLVDGIDSREYKTQDLRAKLGYVPQTAQLFSGTIRDNISFGKTNATDEEINKALNVAQATEFTSTLDKGLDALVEQDGKNFSGGQKQRLSIARALVKKPEIYIFDDSFSALDFKTDLNLRKALHSYTTDSTIIIVAQRVSTIIEADDIIVLDEGKMVGEGTHEELLKTCDVYREIVSSQLDKDEITKTMALSSEEAH